MCVFLSVDTLAQQRVRKRNKRPIHDLKKVAIIKLVGQFDACPLNATKTEEEVAKKRARQAKFSMPLAFHDLPLFSLLLSLPFACTCHLNNNALVVNRCQITFISCINRNKTFSEHAYSYFFFCRSLSLPPSLARARFFCVVL